MAIVIAMATEIMFNIRTPVGTSSPTTEEIIIFKMMIKRIGKADSTRNSTVDKKTAVMRLNA